MINLSESLGNNCAQITQIAGIGGNFVAVDLTLKHEDSCSFNVHILKTPDVLESKKSSSEVQYFFFGFNLFYLRDQLTLIYWKSVLLKSCGIFINKLDFNIFHMNCSGGSIVGEF